MFISKCVIHNLTFISNF